MARSEPTVVVGITGVEQDDTDSRWLVEDLAVLTSLVCGSTGSPTIHSFFNPDVIFNDCGYVIGHQGDARLIVGFPPKTVFKTRADGVKSAFLNQLRSIGTGHQSRKQHLIVIVCSHGMDDGSVGIGNSGRLTKDEVEGALAKFKGRVTLISGACHSGHWQSDRWDLISGCKADQLTHSFPKSKSGFWRGGFFGEAALREFLRTAGIEPPHPFDSTAAHSFINPGIHPTIILSPPASIIETVQRMNQNESLTQLNLIDQQEFFTTSTDLAVKFPFAEMTPAFLDLISIRRV